MAAAQQAAPPQLYSLLQSRSLARRIGRRCVTLLMLQEAPAQDAFPPGCAGTPHTLALQCKQCPFYSATTQERTTNLQERASAKVSNHLLRQHLAAVLAAAAARWQCGMVHCRHTVSVIVRLLHARPAWLRDAPRPVERAVAECSTWPILHAGCKPSACAALMVVVQFCIL